MKIGILPYQGACIVDIMTNKGARNLAENEMINMVCPMGISSVIRNRSGAVYE